MGDNSCCMQGSTLVINPPRAALDEYAGDPEFMNLGALELAGALRARGGDVQLLDAFAQPTSTLSLGASCPQLGTLDGWVPGELDRVLVLWTDQGESAEPGAADPVLVALLESLGAANELVLVADCRSREPELTRVSALAASYPQATRVTTLRQELGHLGAVAAPAWDLIDVAALAEFHKRVRLALRRQTNPSLVLPVRASEQPQLQLEAARQAGASGLYLLDRALGGADHGTQVTQLAERAHGLGLELTQRFELGFAAQTAESINSTLELSMDLWDRFRAYPALVFSTQPEGVTPALLKDFEWTFQRRLQASSGPEKVIMNLTYACNNHCTFCAVGTRTQFHGHTESQREHLLEYRQRGVTMVDFDGGEPTLHPDLFGTVRYARQIGYTNINVTTNGRLAYYDDFARKLVQSGLTTLLFSVHGPDARSHAQQVGVAEAFEQTTGGIRNCVKHAPPGVELGMNITLTKSNAQKLEQITQLAWDLGLRWLNVQFLTPFGRATSSIAPDIDEAAATARDLIDRWRGRMKVQIINLPFCYMPGYEQHLEGDLLKLARHMIFVNNEDVNLAEYLAERRVRKPVCASCPRAVFCGGFYELESAPEPPWIVAAEDLVKKRRPSDVGAVPSR